MLFMLLLCCINIACLYLNYSIFLQNLLWIVTSYNTSWIHLIQYLLIWLASTLKHRWDIPHNDYVLNFHNGFFFNFWWSIWDNGFVAVTKGQNLRTFTTCSYMWWSGKDINNADREQPETESTGTSKWIISLWLFSSPAMAIFTSVSSPTYPTHDELMQLATLNYWRCSKL